VHMKLLHAATAANRISDSAVLMGGALCGILGFTLVLPLALSGPYPTLKQGDWGIQPASSRQASIQPASTQPASTKPALFEVASVRSAPERFDQPSVLEATSLVEAKPSMERPPFAEPSPLVEAATFTVASVETASPVETTSSVTRTPPVLRFSFADRWSPTSYVAEVAASAAIPAEATRLEPSERLATLETPDTPERRAVPSLVRRRDVSAMEEVDQYLWEVYLRQPVKSDSSGDFTWKDPAAAKHKGISLQSYVIGGMDADFREQLYHAGHAMDGDGIHWSMLSAFRDDYRQTLAAGFKARTGNSKHGGSRATGGYGHGQAIDLTTADGDAGAAWHWIDAHGAKYGLHRPIPGPDPAHVQPRNKWHEIAVAMRNARSRLAERESIEGRTKVAGVSK
jgi:hypothetical protein